jgi:hypothetical protein
MRMTESTCPRCHTVNLVGEELIGRYTPCRSCRALFYVEVPPLEKSSQAEPAKPIIAKAQTRETTLDDLLWDTQQGSRFIIESLRRQERRQKLLLLGVLGCGVLLLANLLMLAYR